MTTNHNALSGTNDEAPAVEADDKPMPTDVQRLSRLADLGIAPVVEWGPDAQAQHATGSKGPGYDEFRE